MQIQQEKNKDIVKNIVDDKTDKQVDNLVSDISKNNITKIEVAEAFNDHSKDILQFIKNDITKRKEKITDWTKYLESHKILQTDILQAKKDLQVEKKIATENEKKIYNNIANNYQLYNTNIYNEKEKQLSDLLIITNEIASLLPQKKEEKTEKQIAETEAQTVRNLLTLNYDSQESAKRFFETSNKDDFDLTMKTAYTEAGGKTEPVEIPETNELQKLIETYANTTDIKDMKLGQSNNTYATAYVDGTRVIEAKIGTTLTKDNPNTTINGITYTLKDGTITPEIETGITIEGNTICQTKYIAWGDQQEMQKQKAENTNSADNFTTMRDKTKELNVFDDGGNYEAFRLFLNTKDATFVQNNLATIIEQIKLYTPTPGSADAGENINDLKNGYANVLNDYITNPKTYDNNLMITYIDYLTTNNINILGIDKATRSENYNKIVHTWNEHKEDIKNALGEEKAKEYAEKIVNLGIIIAEQGNTSLQETLKNGLDVIKKTFGPLMLSILKFFGIGKRTLMKRFGKEAEKMYAEEFGWEDKEKINAANTLAGTFTPDAITDTEGNLVKLEKGADIKSEFTADNKTKYIKKLTDNSGYYKYININVLQQGLDAYNKENKTSLNIHDIVTIEKDTTTGKDEITATKGDKIQDILAIMLDNDDLRSSIASAQAEIGTPVKDEKVTGRVNEHGMTQEDARRYKIENKCDIARYITASFFSDKDLAYTLTENNLHNGAKITNKPNNDSESVPTPQETLTFIDGMYDSTTGVTASGAEKKIHDIVKDIENAPDELIVEHNGQEISVTKKIDYEEGDQKFTTYIKADGKRIFVYQGDKITLPEKQTQATLADMRTGIQEELKKQTTTKKTFEGNSYKLDNTNTYQQGIAKISDLFTGENYKNLLEESEQKTLKSIIETNTGDFKNMLVYRGLKQTENIDAIYKTDRVILDPNIIKNIDITKQTFKVTEAKEGNITIEVTKKDIANDAKEGTITLIENATTGKIETKRTEKQAS